MSEHSSSKDRLAVRVMVSCDWCGQTMVIAPGAARRCVRCERREIFLCGEAGKGDSRSES